MAESCRIKSSAGSYEVMIGAGLLALAGEKISSLGVGKQAAVIGDESTLRIYGEVIRESPEKAGLNTSLISIPAGESSKSMEQVTLLLSELAQKKLERNDTIVALGGGVVGDLAGFVAAIYLRGVNLVQIPTTLLAMVDSSVGGKTGVNLPEGKNLAGAFYPPRLVLADITTLKTLPPRELAAGMAEVIKYGIIADTNLFQKVEAGIPMDLEPIIRRCIEIKARIVEEDERETTGVRAILNFGHTIGHAIEKTAGYGKYLHGEAVAIGMRAAAFLSMRKVGLSEAEFVWIEKALAANHLPLRAEGLSPEKIEEALALDKKVKAGVNQWVLTPRIGETVLKSDLTPDEIREAIGQVVS